MLGILDVSKLVYLVEHKPCHLALTKVHAIFFCSKIHHFTFFFNEPNVQLNVEDVFLSFCWHHVAQFGFEMDLLGLFLKHMQCDALLYTISTFL